MGSEMGETDVTFRHLLRGTPRPILRLAFPRCALEPAGLLDPSVDRPRQRTTDNLFRVRDGNAEAAVHLEIERAWRADIPRRLFEYATAAMTATRLPVWSVVVLLRPDGQPPRGTGVYRIPCADGDAIVYHYHVVPLWRLDARRMRAELGLEGAPFCVAMRGADETFVQTLADEVRTDQGLTERDRQTTMQLLYVVSAAILGSDTARRIFHVESIIQDPNVQELIREWEDKGHAKGRIKGRAEGLAKGRTEGRAAEARLLLRKVLKARSFAVTAAVRARIDRETDVARLESWLEAAVTARAIGDVFRDR
jgi:predicted transposase YdaD